MLLLQVVFFVFFLEELHACFDVALFVFDIGLHALLEEEDDFPYWVVVILQVGV